MVSQKELSGPEKERLIQQLNKDHKKDLEYIIKYYDKPAAVGSLEVTDITTDNITLAWESISLGGAITNKVKVFEIDKSWGPASTKKRVLDMSYNSYRSLYMGRYGSTAHHIKFRLPRIEYMIFAIGGLSFLVYLGFMDKANWVTRWMTWFLPRQMYRLLFLSLIFGHGVETIAMIYICRKFQSKTEANSLVLSNDVALKYILSTVAFGGFSVVRFFFQVSKCTDPPNDILSILEDLRNA